MKEVGGGGGFPFWSSCRSIVYLVGFPTRLILLSLYSPRILMPFQFELFGGKGSCGPQELMSRYRSLRFARLFALTWSVMKVLKLALRLEICPKYAVSLPQTAWAGIIDLGN